MSSDEIVALEGMEAVTVPEVVDAPADDSISGLDVTDPAETVKAQPVHTLGQTGAVQLYDVSCGSGASSYIQVPITTPLGWYCRLGYFRANGARISLSGIAQINGSYYPPSVLRARFTGRLPAGTRDLRAFWWYGDGDTRTGPVYWNRSNVSC